MHQIFDFLWGSAPDTPRELTVMYFRGPTAKGKRGKRRRGKKGEGKEGCSLQLGTPNPAVEEGREAGRARKGVWVGASRHFFQL